VSRVNYGQDGTINSFVNTVSLAGSGLAGGQLFSVQGGNVQLCERLLAHAQAEIRTNARVVELAAAQDRPQRNAQYRVVTDRTREDGFDGVILAAPVELTSLQCGNLAAGSPDQFQRPYQVTHVTIVAGALNPTHFGLNPSMSLPETILTPEHPDLVFSSIGKIGHSPTLAQPIYKVFSRAPLDDSHVGRSLCSRRTSLEYAGEHIRYSNPRLDGHHFA
jgi:prenylcysteine oxidase / farnesylcysteine lyase